MHVKHTIACRHAPANRKRSVTCPLCRSDELVYALGTPLSESTDWGEKSMAFYAFYVVAITILVLHFTGWLKRNNLEWVVLVLAVATFPAVIFLR